MIHLEKTEENDIVFIASCLDGKPEDFAGQCGYGSRFFTFPVTAGQIAEFQKKRTGNSHFFTIFSGDTPVGSLELITYPGAEGKKKESCSVARFLIAGEHRSKGYGTEALRQVSDFAFSELGLKKVTLAVFDFNSSALRCYLKARFAEVKRETRDNGWVAIQMELKRPAISDCQ